MLKANNPYCPCCGSEFRTSGCVRGFTCQCTLITTYCKKCYKCKIHCKCGNMVTTKVVRKSVKNDSSKEKV